MIQSCNTEQSKDGSLSDKDVKKHGCMPIQSSMCGPILDFCSHDVQDSFKRKTESDVSDNGV